jgi:hypothetical protein
VTVLKNLAVYGGLFVGSWLVVILPILAWMKLS